MCGAGLLILPISFILTKGMPAASIEVCRKKLRRVYISLD
jgi:hypothetical protein